MATKTMSKPRSREKNVTGEGKAIYKRTPASGTEATSKPRSREKNVTGEGKAIYKRKK